MQYPAAPPHSNIHLREVVAADEPSLFNLFSTCRNELLAAVSSWDTAQQQAFMRMQFDAQRGQYARDFIHARQSVIVDDGEIIGQMVVEYTKEIHLVDLSLLPEYRNHGIGGALLADLLGEAEISGRCMRLHVAQTNPAVRLYLRLGFAQVEEDGFYYRMEWRPAGDRSAADDTRPTTKLS